MDPQEVPRTQLGRESVQGGPQHVRLGASMQSHVVASGLAPVNVGDPHEAGAPLRGDPQPLRRDRPLACDHGAWRCCRGN
jgi:hypothetical protein